MMQTYCEIEKGHIKTNVFKLIKNKETADGEGCLQPFALVMQHKKTIK